MTIRHRRTIVATIGIFALLLGFAGAQDPPKKDKGVPKKEPPPLKKSPFKKKQDPEKTDVLREAGELLNTDPLDPGRGRSAHYKAFTVKMSPGRTYVIRMIHERGGAGGHMDPYLRLEDSAGRNLAENDDDGTSLNSLIQHNPNREDTYKIFATTLGGGQTGKFLLTVEAYPPGRVPRPGGFGGGPSLSTGSSIAAAPPMKHNDVEIRCLTWGQAANPGNNVETHGYIEYRFFIDNHSDSERRITLTLPRRSGGYFNGQYVSALRKTVDVGPRASAQVSLFQPDLPMSYVGAGAEVSIDGRIALQPVPVNTSSNRGARSSAGRFFGGPPPGGPSVSFLTTSSMFNQLAPHQNMLTAAAVAQLLMQQGPEKTEQWSNDWLGYTSFDGVILTGDKLQAAPEDVRTALWQYVECGGTLLVFGSAKFPESWARAKVEFAGLNAYYPGFGQCLMSTQTPDQWVPDQWHAAADMWSSSRSAWQQITSPNEANRALPVVDDLSIPVRGLFVVMVVFVLLIGPINIYWLARAQRRLWLLWTVPAFALLTCLLLVGYMIATEGWNGHTRSETITILDENAQRAATIGWIGYYCPTTPAGGLHFGLDTELTPHLDSRHLRYGSRTTQPCSIDWTKDQHLADGWVTAKVPIHFMVRRNEAKLQRLTAHANPDGSKSVTNALGASIRSLWVARLDGTILGAKDVGEGANATLTPTDLPAAAGDLGTASELFGRHWVQQADEMVKSPAEYLRPGTYMAVIDDSPFLDQGLRRTQSRRARSIVFGIMKEPF